MNQSPSKGYLAHFTFTPTILINPRVRWINLEDTIEDSLNKYFLQINIIIISSNLSRL
jgi:hypothetical protein